MAANELDCVFIVPSQVNKQGTTREADDAENDASALVKIHADESSKDVQPGRIENMEAARAARDTLTLR